MSPLLTLRRDQLARIADDRRRSFVARLAAQWPEPGVSGLDSIVRLGLRHLRSEADIARLTDIVLQHGLLAGTEFPPEVSRLLTNPFVSPSRRLESLERWAIRREKPDGF
ncbi:MAG: hypothetical protein ACOVOT_02320 [Rubrivivax sp.]